MKINETHLCHCGSKEDAFEVALKMIESMVENDCPTWAMQVIAAMGTFQPLLASAMTMSPLGDNMVKETMSFMQMEMSSCIKRKDFAERSSIIIKKIVLTSVEAGVEDRGLLRQIMEAGKG